MSEAEMKKAIAEQISHLNETQLGFVLDVLNKIKVQESKSEIDMNMIFEEAAEKYGDVLKKLAQ